MKIVVDEWIIHHIAGDNGKEKQKVAFQFLERVLEKCDQFVTLRGGGLEKKIYRLQKESAGMPLHHHELAKWFFKTFVSNSDKFVFVDEPQLSKSQTDLLKPVDKKDRFLVKAHLNTEDSIIVTTDLPLQKVLLSKKEIKVALADEFIEGYDC